MLLGKGDGTFQPPVHYRSSGLGAERVISVDLNADGKLDLVTVSHYGQNLSLVRGKGDGTFQAPLHYDASESLSDVVAADWNADGKVDLATTSSYPGTVSLRLSAGCR